MTDLAAAHKELVRLSGAVDDAVDGMKRLAVEYAKAERDYRLAKAKAWLTAPEGTVPQREAWVNGETAALRHARDLAEGMKQAAVEAARSRRTQLSAWQTSVNAHREDMSMGRFGPEMAP